jgi:pimeloyl-ACP methyl ester carboxylesterase
MTNSRTSSRRAVLRPLVRLLRTLAFVWIAVVLLVAVFQRSLIYFPVCESESRLLAVAESARMQPWRDAAGAIIGWRSAVRSEPPAANRLIVFHGNAGYALNRTYYVEAFEQLDGGRAWEVFLFEYPGYGARAGAPGESSFNAAAAAAFAALAAADARPIFLLGESIGSGPACALAGREPQRVAGLCLVTPFQRLADVAAHHYPFLPVRWILRDRWDNIAAVAGYRGRLAMRLAAEDEIIPAAHGRQLFDSYAGPKRLWVEPGANHNGLDYDAANPFWQEASAFLLEGAP